MGNRFIFVLLVLVLGFGTIAQADSAFCIQAFKELNEKELELLEKEMMAVVGYDKLSPRQAYALASMYSMIYGYRAVKDFDLVLKDWGMTSLNSPVLSAVMYLANGFAKVHEIQIGGKWYKEEEYAYTSIAEGMQTETYRDFRYVEPQLREFSEQAERFLSALRLELPDTRRDLDKILTELERSEREQFDAYSLMVSGFEFMNWIPQNLKLQGVQWEAFYEFMKSYTPKDPDLNVSRDFLLMLGPKLFSLENTQRMEALSAEYQGRVYRTGEARNFWDSVMDQADKSMAVVSNIEPHKAVEIVKVIQKSFPFLASSQSIKKFIESPELSRLQEFQFHSKDYFLSMGVRVDLPGFTFQTLSNALYLSMREIQKQDKHLDWLNAFAELDKVYYAALSKVKTKAIN